MKFKNTEDAVTYGKKATAREIDRLRLARAAYISQCQALARTVGHATNLNKRIELATLAQFCREAVEAGGRRI